MPRGNMRHVDYIKGKDKRREIIKPASVNRNLTVVGPPLIFFFKWIPFQFRKDGIKFDGRRTPRLVRSLFVYLF